MSPRPMFSRGTAACAPWVRTRLRTAPGAACALGLLVLLTAFLAAAFPRAVDRYEDEGLRHDLAAAAPRRSMLEVSSPAPGLEVPQAAREKAVREPSVASVHRRLLAGLPDPLRADTGQSAYGLRTTNPIPAGEPWFPRPYGIDPELTYTTQSALPDHSTLREGRWPAARGEVTAATEEVEAAVTEETAKALRIKTGATVSVPAIRGGQFTVRITGIVAPLRPEAAYWSAEPLLRTPSLVAKPTKTEPRYYWTAALLLPPDAAPVLLATTGQPEVYWRIMPDVARLTAPDVPLLRSSVASLEGGPGLLNVRTAVGETATVTTDLDEIVSAYDGMRQAIRPVVTVAAVGIGAVAVIVLLMTGGLIAGRRHTELALLRARGGSLRSLGGRLLAETAVTAVPAAALGLLLAVLVIDGPRLWPSAVGAAAVGALVCAALPVRTVLPHRRPRLHGGREDLVSVRPSRRRTVAELTVLVLAVGAVVALRRRGTGGEGGTDLLVSAAPVLVALIASLVLVRLYPLPLRLALRSVARLRGAVGFLALARAGRSSASGTLPLLALLVALTTAAFGGSVLAGVADARDTAAVLATGADARISGQADSAPLPDGLVRTVSGTDGVQEVARVQIEYGVSLPSPEHGFEDARGATLIGVDPVTYARLARSTGIGTFTADRLKYSGPPTPKGTMPSQDRVLPVLASPSVAERLGDRPRDLQSMAGDFKVRVTGTVAHTPAVSDTSFMIVDAASLTHRQTTALLLTGDRLDAKALRAAAHHAGKDFTVQLRSEARAAYVDTPMQVGAERIYTAAIAAGAGYALLAVLLSLLRTAPERTTLLARLRTMGIGTRQGGRLLGFEAMPQALLAAAGGLLVGRATIALLAPGVDLVHLALSTGPGAGLLYNAPLRADPWSMVLPALGVIVLTAAVAGVQAWWTGRRGSVTELRAGDSR
ncbi:ABC transporter permease [Streptomyces brevispora]|uniref:ABC transporter permease n=1 Tax=Streptomyces brevispora TaxID=887462 RepID=A0A561UUW8_9ACTN|nr:ABC transporter permease [Streptomyces brevispora]TWG03163.1 putative ABC transport system permease protein [Streptomyces brevispora]WSC15769.1 ABC transporter permease [Streptomyces brevispora]